MLLAALDTTRSVEDIDIPGLRLHPLKGASGISPEMALRLSKAIGRSAEGWLAMQYNHDLWQARQRVDLRGVGKLQLHAA